jgi:hypothetical protein
MIIIINFFLFNHSFLNYLIVISFYPKLNLVNLVEIMNLLIKYFSHLIISKLI